MPPPELRVLSTRSGQEVLTLDLRPILTSPGRPDRLKMEGMALLLITDSPLKDLLQSVHGRRREIRMQRRKGRDWSKLRRFNR